jgi:ubiquinone/menaquinone biosynthesis C-methylase UbiE
VNEDHAADCLAAYDAWAATYDVIDNPLVTQSAVLLDERAAWFAGARVLELGCGTGRNAAFARAAGARQYIGVDGSPGMLAVARQRFGDEAVRFIEADLISGAQQAGEGGRFDVVLICLVLEHVADITPVIAAAAALLAPRGRLVILELHADMHARGFGANFRVGDREVRLPSIRHEGDELAAAIRAAGLTVESLRDCRPTPPALARSAKLSRYGDRPVLIEIVGLHES